MQAFSDVQVVSIAALKPHPRNPRLGDLEVVRESLERYGQFQPIVVNLRNDTIVAGHHRWLAAQELGWAEVSVVWVDVDEDTHVRMMLMDNRAAQRGDFDSERLDALLRELADTPDALDGTGYSLEALLAEIAAEDPQEVDAEPATEFLVVITCRSAQEQADLFGKVEDWGQDARMVTR